MHVGGGQAVTQGGGAPVRVLAAYASCISMPIRGLVRPLYRLCTTLRARVVSCSLSFGKQLARVCFDIACRLSVFGSMRRGSPFDTPRSGTWLRAERPLNRPA